MKIECLICMMTKLCSRIFIRCRHCSRCISVNCPTRCALIICMKNLLKLPKHRRTKDLYWCVMWYSNYRHLIIGNILYYNLGVQVWNMKMDFNIIVNLESGRAINTNDENLWFDFIRLSRLVALYNNIYI